MCGICGQLYFDPARRVRPETLVRMTDAMVHRGPDDAGTHISGNAGLGFRRLSIIDLAGGHQPLSNEDGTVWIAFNGEVYNFPELTRDLQAQGHQFRTRTDTEAIVHLYEEVGEACVESLRGMFAFAILDLRRQVLFCARDRFGIKPFYYYADDEQVLFGSELKVVQAAGIPDELDHQALEQYFTYGWIPGDHAITRGVRKLPAGHTLTVPFGAGIAPRVRRYWDIAFEPDESRRETDWLEELEHELSEAVRMRLISDVPLGAFLSGGIDSSSVVALMSRHASGPVKTFSIGFKEAEFNELQYAREVVARYRTEHYEEIVEPQSVDLLPTLVRAYDEPFADPSAIPTWLVSRFARKHVTVVLSGDGGDELFAGYNHYAKWLRIHRLNRLPAPLARLLWGTVHRAMPEGMTGKGLTYYLSRNRHTLPVWFALWNPAERQRLLGARPGVVPGEEFKLDILRRSTAPDFISRGQELDLRSYLVDDILTKVDRASMANSLETRVPLLDHKVAELSFRIPARFKLRGDDKKILLRKCMAPHLPDGVLGHRKQGFAVPFKVWFKEDLRTYLEDRFHSRNTTLGDHVDLAYARKLSREHQRGLRDFSQKLWSLLFFDAWLQQRAAAPQE